jgi:outer membrane protease
VKKTIALFCCCAALLTSSIAAAEEGEKSPLKYSLGIEGGYLAGEMSYHITIPTESALLESELIWPLDSALVGIAGEIGREDRWNLGVSVLTNASSASGDMEDTDWINGLAFIFSDSAVSSESFSALLVKLRGSRRLASFSWGGIDIEGGYLFQYFDLTASDLVQFSPLGIEEFSAVVPGPVVTYKASFSVPHAGLAATWTPAGPFSLTGRVHGGYAFVNDEDDHLLRFKLSEAETDGPAVMAGLAGNYSLGSRISLRLAVEYMALRTEGSQDQVFYGGPNRGLAFRGIPDEIDSEQVSLLAGLTALF